VGAPYGELSEDCIACGACSLVCPTSAISTQRNIFPLTAEDIIRIEEEHLSGERDADLGVCSELFAARTEIQGQDGGVVTSLLARCLDKGVIDAAVVVYQKENNGGRAAAVDDIEGVIKAKGTKYVRVSALAPLIDALRGGKRRVAVVGTPCQIRVIRKLEQLDYFKDEFPDAEIFLVGLFCFESFDYRRLREHSKELLGIDIEDADKIQIAKGRYIATLDGMEHSCSVRELEKDIREGCRFCGDLVSRLADISIGSVGSAEGYSSVIVRSEKGKKLLDGLSFCREKAVREDIVKLARMKRRNADRNLERIRKGM
jgi:coenzyme F420 hydrogenase subunit beta